MWGEGKKDESRGLEDKKKTTSVRSPHAFGGLNGTTTDQKNRGLSIEELNPLSLSLLPRPYSVLTKSFKRSLLARSRLALALAALSEGPEVVRRGPKVLGALREFESSPPSPPSPPPPPPPPPTSSSSSSSSGGGAGLAVSPGARVPYSYARWSAIDLSATSRRSDPSLERGPPAGRLPRARAAASAAAAAEIPASSADDDSGWSMPPSPPPQSRSSAAASISPPLPCCWCCCCCAAPDMTAETASI